MAQGDILGNGVVEVAPGTTCDFKPDTDREAVVHNYAVSGTDGMKWQLEFYDSSASKSMLLVDDSSVVLQTNLYLHCKPTAYYRIKCISGTILVHYDGVITK